MSEKFSKSDIAAASSQLLKPSFDYIIIDYVFCMSTRTNVDDSIGVCKDRNGWSSIVASQLTFVPRRADVSLRR